MKKRGKIRPKKGEIHLIPFPFTDLSQSKLRPCVVIGCDGDDITVVFITTIKPKGSFYIELKQTPSNRLKTTSYARYTKIATLDVQMSLGQTGALDTSTYQKLTKAIRDFIE